MKQVLTLFTIFLIFSIGCKESTGLNDSELSSGEKNYFEDYIPTVFKWGYIDKNGGLAIPAIFDNVRDYAEGLAAVNYKGKWGYIDKEGNTAIDFRYRSANNFSSGTALVQDFDLGYHYVDRTGRRIFERQFEEAWSYHDGIARIKMNGLFKYIDTLGMPISDDSYEKASNYIDGYAVVKDQDGEKIIDRSGKSILTSHFPKVYLPSNKMIRIKTQKGFSYIGLPELKVWDIFFENNTNFYNEVAAVKSGKWYLVDKNQNKISESYDHIEYGGENVWLVTLGETKGVVNNDGKPITEIKYDILYRFSEGISAYAINDFWGFLNVEGEEITGPVFPLVWEFKNGVARAIFGGGIGFVDSNGQVVIPPKYIEVRDFYEGLARVQIVK